MLWQSDVFALPCREGRGGDRDELPVVLIEAVACGVPVISGDLPAIRKLVRHGDIGTHVDAHGSAPYRLSLHVSSAIRGCGLWITHAGRAWVESEFSLAVKVNRLCN